MIGAQVVANLVSKGVPGFTRGECSRVDPIEVVSDARSTPWRAVAQHTNES